MLLLLWAGPSATAGPVEPSGAASSLGIPTHAPYLLLAQNVHWLTPSRVLGLFIIAVIMVAAAVVWNMTLHQLVKAQTFQIGQQLESIRESEERFRTLVECMGQGLLQLDSQGVITFANRQICLLVGKDLDGLTGRSCGDLIPSVDQRAAFLAWMKSSATPLRTIDVVFRGPGGREVPVECACSPIPGQGVEVGGYICMVTDLRERLRAEEERLQLERKLLEGQRMESLGVMAGGVAHDFNNLLTVVLGNTSMARLQLPSDSPLHGCLEEVEDASLRAADLCTRMLAYSGRGRFVLEPTDLNAAIEDSLRLLRPTLNPKAELQKALDFSVGRIKGDGTQVRQMLAALVVNASEAIGEEPGVIRISTRTTTLDAPRIAALRFGEGVVPGEYAVVEVSDSGSGMSEEVASRSFDPFFSTKFQGRGLGLFVVAGVIRGHRGGLALKTAPGKGATFTVYLPLAPKPEPDATTPKSTTPAVAVSGRVLVVDDEDAVRMMMSRVLTDWGLEVVEAVDGIDACEKFFKEPETYRLVVLDMTMPRQDGRETFQRLVERRPELPVLFVSGYDQASLDLPEDPEYRVGFLHKPFIPEALRREAASMLARS